MSLQNANAPANEELDMAALERSFADASLFHFLGFRYVPGSERFVDCRIDGYESDGEERPYRLARISHRWGPSSESSDSSNSEDSDEIDS